MRSPLNLLVTALLCLLLIFGMLAGAHGQVVFPLPECVQRPALSLPVPTLPSGLPEQLGGTCSAVPEFNTNGASVLLLCKQQYGPPEANLYAVRKDSITPALMKDLSQLGLPGDNRERIRQIQAKYQTVHVWDMCDVWGPARDAMNAAYVEATMPPKPPPAPAPAWVTAATPAYTLRNGSLLSSGSVTKGAACDCSKPYVLGSSTYCPLRPPASPTQLARCVKPAP